MSDKSSDTGKLAGMAFNEALERLANTKPKELAAAVNSSMKDGAIERLVAAFEDAGRWDDDGTEFWTARDLARLLEYSDYRNFLNIVDKAKAACLNAGQKPADHFVDVTDMIEIGKGGERPVEDIHLTRYASYLIAQNGDPRKKPVAFAQTYFAIQTRRQEILDEEAAQYVPLSEEQKRVLLREEIKEHNKNLASAAKGAGVVEPLDYAIFQTHGYKGLYGGLDRIGIQRARDYGPSSRSLTTWAARNLRQTCFAPLRRKRSFGATALRARMQPTPPISMLGQLSAARFGRSAARCPKTYPRLKISQKSVVDLRRESPARARKLPPIKGPQR